MLLRYVHKQNATLHIRAQVFVLDQLDRALPLTYPTAMTSLSAVPCMTLMLARSRLPDQRPGHLDVEMRETLGSDSYLLKVTNRACRPQMSWPRRFHC